MVYCPSVAHVIAILVTADLTNILQSASHVLIHEPPPCCHNTGQRALLPADEVAETQRGQTTSLRSHSSEYHKGAFSANNTKPETPPQRNFCKFPHLQNGIIIPQTLEAEPIKINRGQ